MDPNNNLEHGEAEAFEEALDPLVADITSLDVVSCKAQMIPELTIALSWLREAVYYNLPHGKRNRGLAVVVTHKILSKHFNHAPDLARARILGWCIEMLQAHFLILDDIMDESTTRRGQKCWHLKKDVGMTAINDSCFIQQSIFFLLKKHFSTSPVFVDLMTIFLDTLMRTTVGQCLDLISSAKPGQIPDTEKFTRDKYDAIVDHKTSFYSFSAPIRLAMIMSGLTDPIVHAKADIILRRMGHYFQVQDDFLDCFGDPIVMGKIGTDIEEGKCCWLIVTALSMANSEQKAILQQNYARKDKINTDAVKQVYRELGMEQVYKRYELDTTTEIGGMIDQFSKETGLPGETFHFMLSKISGRQK